MPSEDEQIRLVIARLPISEGQLHVLCPSGIGDLAWLWSKWWKVAEERDVTLWFPDGETHRAGELAQLYGVKYRYLPHLSSNWVWAQPGAPSIPDSGAVLAVQPNRHLETGHRLEKWYPDLPFRLPVPQTLGGSYRLDINSPPYAVVHACQHGYMERGGNLLPGQWARICRMLEKQVAPVQLVGAGSDTTLIEDILRLWQPSFAPALGVPLAELLPVLEQARAVVGVASGITIMSTYIGSPTFIGYPHWLAQMPGTWEQDASLVGWTFLDNLENAVREGAVERLLNDCRSSDADQPLPNFLSVRPATVSALPSEGVHGDDLPGEPPACKARVGVGKR